MRMENTTIWGGGVILISCMAVIRRTMNPLEGGAALCLPSLCEPGSELRKEKKCEEGDTHREMVCR